MAQGRSELQKHWVCYVGNEIAMKDYAVNWVTQKSRDWGKNYELIELSPHPKDTLVAVKPNDILYIYCHGNPSATVLWMSNFEGKAKDENGKPLKETTYTAAEFLEFIKSQGLNRQHKELRIAACYSDKFAKELYLLAKK